MLKRRAFLLLGSAATVVGVNEAQAFFMGGVGVSGLTNLQAPTITSMTPNNGLVAGGNTISFVGFSFAGITDVTFGGTLATNVVITGNDVMTCTAPGHINGAVNVVLTNAAGQSSPTTYTYGSPPVVTSISPTSGPIAGGTPVQIFGSSFTGATEVRIGGTLATSFVFVSDGQVNCTTPAGNGVDDVVVTNPNGSGTLAAAFTYTGTYSASFPLGNFTVVYQEAGSAPSANGDGTTGWQTPSSGPQLSGWTLLQMWWNAPANGYYKFVVPARCTAFSAIPGNSLAVWIDQAPIQYDGGTTSNLNWYMAFVSNIGTTSSANINYSFTAPITAGWHSILVYLCNGAHYGLIGATNNPTHYDRLNINSTGTALPAEPAGSRNPALQPFSSYHFINTPFGANAQFLALNSPASQTLNGTGGNGANVALNTKDYSADIWLGEATDPIWSVTCSDTGSSGGVPTAPLSTPYPVRAPAGAKASNDNPDRNVAFVDTTNPRYFYTGIEWFQNGPRTANFNMRVLDSYNLNHAVPQSWGNTSGLIRLYDCDNGVIAHRLLGHMGFPPGNPPFGPSPGGYATAGQTSQWSGMPWPGCESDSAWKQANEYNNPDGVPYGAVAGIHPSAVRPSGMNAATAMLWDCLANYGVWMNVTGGTYPTWGIYGESAVWNHPALVGINWGTILPNLAVMTATSQAPIVVGQGLGGGAPKVPLAPGITQGYPSLGQAPFTFPSSPAGIPLQFACARPGSVFFSGIASAFPYVTFGTVPIGSLVFFALTLDRAAAVNFTSFIDNASGAGTANVYSLIQPAANASTWHPTIAYCASTTRAIPSGTTWTAVLSPLGIANYNFQGAFYLTPTGTVSLRVSNSALSATGVTTLSTSLAGVQANDLVLGFTYTSSYAEINDPAGMGSLNPTPPMTQSFQYAPSTATFNYNPTWDRSSAAQLVAVAFNVGASGSAPTVTTVFPSSGMGGTETTITGTNFLGATAVTFAGTAASAFTVVDSTHIRAVVPLHAAGTASVVVTNASGFNSANSAFTYGLTELSTLSSVLSFPNLYVMGVQNNGAPITTKAQWALRRQEMKEQLAFYALGHHPQFYTTSWVSTTTDTTLTTSSGTMRKLVHQCKTNGPGAGVPFFVNMYIPTNSGSGPFPVIVSGEAGWSPFESFGSAAPATLAQLNQLVNRGYILAEFSRDKFSFDFRDDGAEGIYNTSVTSPGGVRIYGLPNGGSGGLFPTDRNSGPTIAVPNCTAGFNAPPHGLGGVTGYDMGTQIMWSWGGRHVCDYLMTAPQVAGIVNPAKVAGTGISRGSQWTYQAAAWDERIAAALPNQGIGFMALRTMENLPWDVDSSTAPVNASTGVVDCYWNARRAVQFQGSQVTPTGAIRTVFDFQTRVPYDGHTWISLIAPRGFYNCSSSPYNQDSNLATAQLVLAARTAWTALGANPNLCQCHWTDVSGSNGFHSMQFEPWNRMIDYCNFLYNGTALTANVLTAGSQSIWSSDLASMQFAANNVTSPGQLTVAHLAVPTFSWSTPILT